jgi:hypothetical protein
MWNAHANSIGMQYQQSQHQRTYSQAAQRSTAPINFNGGERVQIEAYNYCLGDALHYQSNTTAECKRGVVICGQEDPGLFSK